MTKQRVFIANRGEILRRIATSAKRLGIETVAIKGQVEPFQYLSGLIDRYVTVEEENTALYLDGAKMVAFAKDAGCTLLHPGFGFLSENAEFAQAVGDAGMKWVGPTPEVITKMANKDAARKVAERIGVPCTKGLSEFEIPDSEEGDFSQVIQFAEDAGYPLLAKAALGGGGKGMRKIGSKEEIPSALVRAHSEALSSFGDGQIILEQYIEKSRHIEVQILADEHGNVAAIGDRDCSVQRRHQKILEEAPAPGLLPETRKLLHDSAVKLAKDVGYCSTGTVEFLLNWTEEAISENKQDLYFLEMNTRLQVEHPVTEEVYGIDLVEWQFRVAFGEKIPPHYTQLEPKGWSIEARIYGEDPEANFMPSPGILHFFKPYQSVGVRWEIGLDTVDEITNKFDPMISKVIATGETREAALQRLALALDETAIFGPKTNREFLSYLCRESDYARGPVATAFLEEQLASVIAKMSDARSKHTDELNAVKAFVEKNGLGGDGGSSGVNVEGVLTSVFGGKATTSTNEEFVSSGTMTFTNKRVSPYPSSVAQIFATKNERSYWVCQFKDIKERILHVQADGVHFVDRQTRSKLAAAATHAQGGGVVSPVPGKIMAHFVKEGDEVVEDQKLFVLESMKMEFEVKATGGGVVEEICFDVGDQVDSGEILAKISE